MALSKQQVEELLKGLEKKQADDLKAKNLDGIASHYHPDATLIHKGVKAYYGREEIKEAFKPFLAASNNDSDEIPTTPLYAESSADGQYLIRRGTYKFGQNPKDFPFEQIYKKVDGHYLIYHDEFEFSA
ncbi:hypothetical protein M3Y97_01009800 [Aphelenchoides bicaudatus]|nr:hypothetical protein M3Y97_01009800 [Aphelenchoides bicaudatus]